MTNDGIPATLVAGDGWAWLDAAAFAAAPPPEWGLSYVLRPMTGGAPVVVVAIWGDGAYSLSVAPEVTAALAPGEYSWASVAEGDASGNRRTLASGRVTILPDPMAATAGDGRSAAARIMDAIDATLEGRVTKDAESYSIEGRSISRTPVADLLRLKSHYAAILARERNPRAGFVQYRRISL